jgi:hypothetical protein
MTPEIVTMRGGTLIVTCACLLGLSCLGKHDNEVTWTTRAPSPDSSLIAVARNIQTGGFGTNASWTTVSIAVRSEQEQEILEFDNSTVKNLSLRWLGPKCLLVSYGPMAGVKPGLQAVRFADVSIVTRDRSQPVGAGSKGNGCLSIAACVDVAGSLGLPADYVSCVVSAAHAE